MQLVLRDADLELWHVVLVGVVLVAARSVLVEAYLELWHVVLAGVYYSTCRSSFRARCSLP